MARTLMARLLEKRESNATAPLTTTCPAAIGAIRACWERGVRVGKHLPIASVNIEPPTEFFCPSITGLDMPDLAEVLSQCCDEFFRRSAGRSFDLLEPKASAHFAGESTARPA